jgi:nucleoside-diphosphate-sugar epimerase
MNNILVTGSGGFIGNHLMNELNKRNLKYFAATRGNGDISSPRTWNDFPDSKVVIHLAGKSFVPDSWSNSYGFTETNLLSTICALEYCKQRNAKLIFLSSYMYGNPLSLPIPEDAQIKVQNPYALTKKWSEEACEFYSNNFNFPVIIIRPFNVYGPGQPSNFLLPHIISQLKLENEIRVKDLTPKRDYVYVKDLINAILKAVEADLGFEIFNIGSGESYSVGDIISIVQKLNNSNLPVYSEETSRKGEILDTIADISKALKILDWYPQWDISKGLKETLEGEN